jgi:hypothetical protein
MREHGAAIAGLALVVVAVGAVAIIARPSASAASGGYEWQVLADSPRGYWRLGETSGSVAADKTGVNAGSYQNGVTLGLPGAILGEPDTAAHFDGVDDAVSMGDPASGALDFGTGDFTIEAWVKTTLNGERVIASKQASGAYWQVTVTDDYGAAGRVRARLSSGSTILQGYGPAVHVDDGAWHHVAVLFARRTGITIYVDKAYSQQTPGSMTKSVSNTSPFLIGGPVGPYPGFKGQIDDMAVYPRLLSPNRIQAHYDAVMAADTTSPRVSISSPASGASVADTTPTFSGVAGQAVGDSATVRVNVYNGSSATGTPVQTVTSTRDSRRAWAAAAQPAVAPGTHTAQAVQSDVAGHTGRSAPVTFTVTRPAPPAPDDPTLLAAGDIASCSSTGDEATAALLDGLPGTVATLGNNVYESGTDKEFADCYQPSWGRHKARTHPALGDHEYQTSGASGYFKYFGVAAGDPRKGYYSYDLGSWHMVVLNSNCGQIGGCQPGSAQERWLRKDLSLHPATCTLATIGSPLFSSGSRVGDNLQMQPLWQALYDYGADVVLTGDDHDYERFAPQTPAGTLSLGSGITEFVVGTGGRSHYAFPVGVPAPNSQLRNDDTFGVLKLRLMQAGYRWQFVPIAGKTFTDSGSRGCV